MTDKPLEKILADFKNSLVIDKIFDNPQEYLKDVFSDAVEFDNGICVFRKSVDITDFLILPKGEYHFLEDVGLELWNPLTIIHAGSILRFGDKSKLKIFSGRFFAEGTEEDPIYFLPTSSENTCEIDIHMQITQRFTMGMLKKAKTGKIPTYAGLNHCIFQGLKNRFTGAALNLNEGMTMLNNCEITGCSGYQGGGIQAKNATLYVKGGKISNNFAASSGAAVCAMESSALFEDVDIEHNRNANTLGGAITVHGSKMSWPAEAFEDVKVDIPEIPKHYHFKGCRIRHNVGSGGGAFYIMKGLVELEDDCVLEGNSKPQIYLGAAGSAEAKYNPEIIKDGNE